MVLLVLVGIVWRIWEGGLGDSKPTPPESMEEGVYAVERVVDGDTLVLENGARIRLIGVNTPETVAPGKDVEEFGPEASAYTKQFVEEAGGEVTLRFDKERLDRYDRFLAYVYSGDRFLNEELILVGLSPAETQYNNNPTLERRFEKAEEDARARRVGLWSLEASP